MSERLQENSFCQQPQVFPAGIAPTAARSLRRAPTVPGALGLSKQAQHLGGGQTRRDDSRSANPSDYLAQQDLSESAALSPRDSGEAIVDLSDQLSRRRGSDRSLRQH